MIDVESDDQPYSFIANPLYDGAFADCWCICATSDYCLDVFCTTEDDYPLDVLRPTAEDYPFFYLYKFATKRPQGRYNQYCGSRRSALCK